jgi:hypothetical protein
MADAPRTVVVEWSDVKRAYLAAIEDGKTIPNQKGMNSKIKGWHKYPTASNSWEGGSPADTCNYLRNGYHAETFAHSAEYAAISVRNRFAYNEEEGEIDIDRVLDGQDAIYLNREERESRPGLRLMIEFAFVHEFFGLSQRTSEVILRWMSACVIQRGNDSRDTCGQERHLPKVANSSGNTCIWRRGRRACDRARGRSFHWRRDAVARRWSWSCARGHG